MTKANKPESVAEILARRKQADADGKKQNKKKTATVKKATAKKPAQKKAGKRVAKKPTRKDAKSPSNLPPMYSDLTKLKHPAGYLEFIDFLATPTHLREHETQEEFSKVIGVDKGTLSDWKKRAGFYEDLRERRKNIIREEMIGSAISALHRRVLKEGGASEVKLLLQIADEFMEKSEVKTTSQIQALSVERKEAILKRLDNWKNPAPKV